MNPLSDLLKRNVPTLDKNQLKIDTKKGNVISQIASATNSVIDSNTNKTTFSTRQLDPNIPGLIKFKCKCRHLDCNADMVLSELEPIDSNWEETYICSKNQTHPKCIWLISGDYPIAEGDSKHSVSANLTIDYLQPK